MNITNLQMTNTVFINFWAVEEKSKHYKGDIGVEMVKKLFTICTDIDYIIWLCPISVKQTDYLQFLFEEIEIHEDEEIDERALGNNRILILRRESYLSRLSVREARVEDNDDLLPILLRSNPALIDGQEKFFLANLIQTRDESNRFYVGISENKLVGMLATSTDVNISLIKKFFDIDDFSDIILKREPKPKPPVRKIALVGNVHYLEESAIADLAAQLNCVLVDATLMLLQLDLKLRSQSEHDIDSAMLALRVLDSLIIEACDDFKSVNEGIPPAACIVTGFPRNEAEVGAILNLPSILDVVIEVSRTLSDSAQVGYHEPDMEEDATTLCHMDAADMLRMMYFSDEEIADSFRGHVQWIQLPDEGDILTLITEELTGVITRIETELRELLGDDNEEDKFHSNAFAVTLFCSEVGFETRAVDMLRVAFEDVASLDYCLCMVPNSSPVLPLVELMTPVKVRPGMSFEQSLYVMGKETFLASENVRVVRLTEELLPYFGKFLKPLGSAQDGAMAAARSSLHFNDFSLDENPLEVSYVMLFDKEVVGFVAISRRHVTDDDVTKMRASYRLDEIIDYEKYKSRSQAVISHWILSPIFFRWSRYILREVMRQSEKSLLYYQGIYGAAPAAEIVEELIPVAPRKMMQEPGRLRMKDRSRDLRKNDKGPLYLITRKKLSQRKATVNSRIVIAGGTSYAHAVLETFCFFPDVNFSNIYVVNDRLSTPFLLEEFGRTITGEGGQEDVLDMEFSGCLSVRDVSDPPHSNMYTLGLAFKSTLVRGHLTDIDRINKSIIVSDEVALEYDLLLIASPNQGKF